MYLKINKQHGFSLVELMVAMVAGLLLVAAVTALFATIIKAQSTALQVSRLNQELQSITDMIARDLQRAGYDAKATDLLTAPSGTRSTFYFDSSADLLDGSVSGGVTRYRCIRIRYDDNANGVLNNTTAAGETRIYSYSSADKGVKLDAGTAASCTNGSLLSTEDTIQVTDLTFTQLSGSVATGARMIQLNIAGQHKSAPQLKLTLQRDIKLRNDGY